MASRGESPSGLVGRSRKRSRERSTRRLSRRDEGRSRSREPLPERGRRGTRQHSGELQKETEALTKGKDPPVLEEDANSKGELQRDFSVDLGENVRLQDLKAVLVKINDQLSELRRSQPGSVDEARHQKKVAELSQRKKMLVTRKEELRSLSDSRLRQKGLIANKLEASRKLTKLLEEEKEDDEKVSAELKRRAELRQREQEEDGRRTAELLLREQNRREKAKEHQANESSLESRLRDLQRDEKEEVRQLDEIENEIDECSTMRCKLIHEHEDLQRALSDHMNKIESLSSKEKLCRERLTKVSQLAEQEERAGNVQPFAQDDEASQLAEQEERAGNEQISPQDDEAVLEKWVLGLDGGRGSMLCYLEALRREFEHLEALRASYLEVSINGSVTGHIDPAVWEAIGADKQGHRLLIAKGIIALCKS